MSGITDEMVDVARETFASACGAVYPTDFDDGSPVPMRAALEAVYGDIRKQVAEEIARAIPAFHACARIAREIGGQS